jgi:glycine cleavage system H protein
VNIPEELKYTKEHEWVRLDGDVAEVGITDFAQGELGDIVFVELPESGSEVKQMESFGTIEAVKAVSEMYSPVTGTVDAVNDLIEEDAGIINNDPYGQGWMIKIKISNPEEIEDLLSADQYREIITE